MRIRSVRGLRFIAVVLVYSVVMTTAALAATFSTPGSLPGGAPVVDSDSGSGERWGRSGGRDMTFSVNTPANFSALHWGVVSGTVPTVALDGTVTAGTAEYLTLNAAESNFSAGLARWNGSAVVNLVTGPATIQTRFTLRMTRNSVALALTNVPAGVSPGVNALTSPSFTANLLFEGLENGVWQPLLEHYDRLPTPPGNAPGTTGPAMTGIQTGFYFDAAVGMTLVDHDRNVTQRLISIKDDTAFLRIETVNRLVGLSQQTSAISQQISALPAVQIPQNIATRTNVQDGTRETQNLLFILWGINPCPDPAMCSAIRFIKDLATQVSVDSVKASVGTLTTKVDTVQTKVETVQTRVETVQTKVEALQASLTAALAAAHLDVEAEELGDGPKSRRWIVKTTREGVHVDGQLTRIVVIRTDKQPAVAQDVTYLATIVPFATGLHDVTLKIVKDISDGGAYQFEVRRTDGSSVIQGSTLVSASAKNN